MASRTIGDECIEAALNPVTMRFERVILYQSARTFYLVGSDAMRITSSVLRLDRTVARPNSLSDIMIEDPRQYKRQELEEEIRKWNIEQKGVTLKLEGYGIVGFIRFLDCFYCTIITQRKEVGCIGNNFIYQVKAVEVVPIRESERNEGNAVSKMWKKLSRRLNQTTTDVAETRYLGLFEFIDLSKDFYFSYTYDLTHSLQYNYVMSKENCYPPPPPNDAFEWNKHQTSPIRNTLGENSFSTTHWVLPMIHGSFAQKHFSVCGRMLDLVLLARRSTEYAGTRYLKRGVSVHGKAANDVEIEQIVQFGTGRTAQFASFVQLRASIPTYWSQETSVTNPKPPILISRSDPCYLASKSHFRDLFRRYGSPIVALDLVRQAERRQRESLVGREFRHAVEAVNQVRLMGLWVLALFALFIFLFTLYFLFVSRRDLGEHSYMNSTKYS
jgi:hypothetical protein